LKLEHIAIGVCLGIAASTTALASYVTTQNELISSHKVLPTEVFGHTYENEKYILSKYNDFADLRMTSSFVLILSWRGEVPAKVSNDLHSIFRDTVIIEKQVPFNLRQLEASKAATEATLGRLEAQGVVKLPSADIGLDCASILVAFGLTDPATKDQVVAEIEINQPVPVKVVETGINGVFT
jgi:hypothetical protein